ncbi:DUF2961 domain-containing protein [Tetragenococcus halophilus]|uniref:DUF2961 domain-containing protein n=1 Tax=Tetragenococcus halophilus TaxID=51669 RepID=A0A3G5FJ48_TETHA|nr:glycoside hydrolase family 172 protein [Tetragenococcus halophilus]AYW50158.1 DUF2961 domain-containing protein [Tetragenococcus halophilus]GBD64583.1 putative uncharacterized protein [Tetragenococcus halophilus subsp. flandriensis]
MQTYTYPDLVNKLVNLRNLAVPPVKGETSGTFSSYDRSSVYDETTDTYQEWGANRDGDGFIRKEEEGMVVLELDGPGVIWRVWSAIAKEGHMKIFIDGKKTPVFDRPFRAFFESYSDERSPLNFPELTPILSRGRNSYVPISFQKSIKIIFEEGWGEYYHFTYTTFPKGTIVPSYTGVFDKESSIALAKVDRKLYRKQDAHEKIENIKEEKIQKVIQSKQKETIFETVNSGAMTKFVIRPKFTDFSQEEITEILRSVTLSIFWDDDEKASVWSPLGDFFGTAPGINSYQSLPLGMTEEYFYSNWFMPYTKGVKVIIENEGEQKIDIEASICHTPLPIEETSHLLRFHAKWHRDEFLDLDKERFKKNGDRWPDWPLLLVEGKGRYCGVSMHVYNTWEQPEEEPQTWWYGRWKDKTIDWWWGEGDEKFFIDNEKFPSTFGTGSEDYIGYAWAAEPPFSMFESAFASQPYVELDANGHTSVNRFHVGDNVPFQEKFEGFIEKYKSNHWGENNCCIYSTVVYWYQEPDVKDKYGKVNLKERLKYIHN